MKLHKNDNIKGILETMISDKGALIKSIDRGYHLCRQATEHWGIEGAFDVAYISLLSNKDGIFFDSNTLCTTTTNKFPEELWNIILSYENRQSIRHYAEVCGFCFGEDKTKKPELAKPRFSYIEEMSEWGWTHGHLTIRGSDERIVHRIRLDKLGSLDYSYQRSTLLNFPWLKDALLKVSKPFKMMYEHMSMVEKTEHKLRTLRTQLKCLSETHIDGIDNATQEMVVNTVQKALTIAAGDEDYDTKRKKIVELIRRFHTFTLPANKRTAGLVPLPQDEDDNPYM